MRDVLNSHTVVNLKKEISKTNIKGYSKLKKADVINLMLKHKDRFSHIKHTKDSKLVKKEKPKKKTFTITKASGQKVVLQSRKKTKPKKRRRSTPYLPNDESGGY